MEPDDADDVDDLGGFDELGAFGAPLPPEDRLWRHPSELAGASSYAGRPTRSHRWTTVVLAAAAGSFSTMVVLAATGALDVHEPGPRPTIVRPAVSTGVDGGATTVEPVAAAERTLSAVVRLEVIGANAAALGSGVLFQPDGHLVTNAHVVQGAEAITVVLADGRRLTGSLVGIDTETDIAVVRLVGEGPFPVATFGSVSDASVGEPVVVVGASRKADGTPTVTAGQLNALGREVRSESGLTLLDMIQTNATMAPGSSGGALMDTQGRVIGICTAFAVVNGLPAAGYATPIDVARAVAVDLLAGGSYRPAWLGVRGADRADGGVTLVDVLDGSPAALAGLLPGDVVMAVDKHPIDTMSSMRVTMRVHHPGDTVAISFERSGQVFDARATLGSRPSS